jgi:hypothetical protein
MMFSKVFRQVFGRAGWIGWSVGAAALLAGCSSTGDYVYQTRTAYGEKLRIPLERGAPLPAQEGTILVRAARLLPLGDGSTKKVFYYFEFVDSSGATPRSVRVEDVTDETPMFIVEDKNPKLLDNHWVGRSEQLDAASPLLGWVSYIDDSMRVYRFTVVTADGKELILNQAWSVPAWFKAAMRKTLGME